MDRIKQQVIAVCKKCLLIPAIVTGAVLFMAPATQPLSAQLINVSQPFQTSNDSYYERFGVNFGLNFGGGGRIVGLNQFGQLTPRIQLTQGSAAGTIPAFGGYDPNSPLRTGIAGIGGDIGFSFGLVAGKGSTRSITSQTPSVTMFNGQSGSIFSGSNRPFITSITPVVGGGMRMPTIYARPLNMPPMEPLDLEAPVKRHVSAESVYSNPSSSAEQGAMSLREIRKRKAAEASALSSELRTEINDLVTKAEQATANGYYGAARVKYNNALRKIGDDSAHEELRTELLEKLKAIKSKR